ncbi:hypothetical protein BJV77DRAFT_583778 [Russula vinacea]|nr:hypothetical protein BJV77DRAFT_583778 [Russula vinacea]
MLWFTSLLLPPASARALQTLISSQEGCSSDPELVPPSSPYDPSSAADTPPTDVGLVVISDSPESGSVSSVSSPASLRDVIDLSTEQGTAKLPIVIEGSPICEFPSRTLPWHIPFQPLPLGKPKQLKHDSPDAPLPDASTQHIRDSVMRVQATPNSLVRRRRRSSQPPLDSNLYLPLNEVLSVDNVSNELAGSCRRVRSSEHQADANSILGCHGDLHPAVSSIFGLASELQSVKETSQQHWNQKWRPRRAEHILGNERKACYLREWMHALRLHFDSGSSSTIKGTKSRRNPKKRKRRDKRPEVVREVTRKRKKAGDLDGWLVGDDDEDDEDDNLNEVFDGLENFDDGSLPSSLDPSEPRPISFGKKIRNTILLVGPPGSGKTAAVYACVEELGWNVFEVHPGLGKRGGTHLDDLIGDVGKNHTLPQPLLFQRGRSEPPSPVKRRSTNTVDTINKIPETEIHPQSVVLIEEADVVFADEAGFWPSVVAFIRDSRRPVIITCNGGITIVSGFCAAGTHVRRLPYRCVPDPGWILATTSYADLQLTTLVLDSATVKCYLSGGGSANRRTGRWSSGGADRYG